MTYTRQSPLGWLVCAAVVLGACGCATNAGQTRATRSRPTLPPAVSDHSTAPAGADEAAVRPRVEVTIDQADAGGLHTVGAHKVLVREGRRCYRLALNKDRKLQGTLVYEVLITGNGHVGGVDKLSTSAPSQRLEHCVESAIEGLRFDVSAAAQAMVHRLYIRLDVSREVFDPDRPPVSVR